MSKNFCKYFLIYMSISHIGWLWETLYMLAVTGVFNDRGFLHLPFCPIYGTVILGVYFFLGTPIEGRGILSKQRNDVALTLMYLGYSFIFVTTAELIIGAFFTEVIGVSLWSYTTLPYNTGGHVALEISIIWTIAIYLFMRFIFARIHRFFFSLNYKIVMSLSSLLLFGVFIDFIFTLLTL